MMVLALIAVILSLGAINGLIPIIVILILLVAAAGLNRGYSLFNFFGITTLTSINPAGKASLGGKGAFVLPLLGQHAGSLGIGKRMRAAQARRKAIKTATSTLIGTSAAAAATRGMALPGAMLLGRPAGRATMFKRRMGRAYGKFVTGTPGVAMGARRRPRKVANWTAQRASGANAALSSKGGAYSKTAGRTVSAAAKASAALKRRWQSRSRASRIATGVGLGIGFVAITPVLGIAYGVTRAGHKLQQLSKPTPANAIDKRNAGSFWKNLSPSLPAHTTGVGKTMWLAANPATYVIYRGVQGFNNMRYRKPAAESKRAASLAANPSYDSARAVIASHAAKYGGDVSQMTKSERKAMEKDVKGEVKRIHYSSANSGSYERSVPMAAAAALYRAAKGLAEGYHVAQRQAAAVSGATTASGLAGPAIIVPGGRVAPMKVRDWPSKIREKLSEAGTLPTSTAYGVMFRGVVGTAAVAAATTRSHIATPDVHGQRNSKEQALAEAASTNSTVVKMLESARLEHLNRLKDPDRIDNFWQKTVDNVAYRQSVANSLNAEANRLKEREAAARRRVTGASGAEEAAKHAEEADRLGKQAEERMKMAKEQADILERKTHELNAIRVGIASNAHTSSSTLSALYLSQKGHGTGDMAASNLREALAGNSNTPIDILRTLGSDGENRERLAAASNPSTPRDVLESMSATPYKGKGEDEINKAAPEQAKSARASAELGKTADGTLKARMDLARDTRTSPTVLSAIGSAGNEAEQIAVASNPSTPVELLGQLRSSPNTAVRAAAERSLGRRKAGGAATSTT